MVAGRLPQGDLSLLAGDGHAGLPCGHIVAYKADHDLQVRFARELQSRLHLAAGELQEVPDPPQAGGEDVSDANG